jgi:hypothetical protein
MTAQASREKIPAKLPCGREEKCGIPTWHVHRQDATDGRAQEAAPERNRTQRAVRLWHSGVARAMPGCDKVRESARGGFEKYHR